MRKNVLVIVVFVTAFGLSLITPLADFESYSRQAFEQNAFTTSGIGDNTEDFVDQLSDLYAPSDTGTHSVFADLQDYGSNYDQVTEADQGSAGNNVEDFVDQISDLHAPSPDVGTHSPFPEMQDKDGTYDTLTEADTGGGTPESWTSPTSFSDPSNDWNTETNAYDENTGTSADCDYSSGTGNWQGYLELNLTSAVTSSKCRWWITTGPKFNNWEVSVRDDPDWTVVLITPSPTTGAWVNTTFTTQSVDAIRVRFSYSTGADSGTNSLFETDVLEDAVAGGSNYDLDLEVGWTTADFDETTGEELCIFGGTQGSEALSVDVWDGSWTNIFTDVAAGWNNVSVASYLVDATFEIRFTDASDDAVAADTWQVEGVLLHCWTDAVVDYELDLEIGWTTADFDETSGEELCIYPITGGGWPSENIIVEVYSGGWVQVFADLTPDLWNNISVSSYLTDATFEMRFLGGTEDGDSTQDTWEIDAVLLHTWTTSYAPVNDQKSTLDNPTDTDRMYSQYIEYQVTVYVSDQNGFADIDYLEWSLWDNTRTTEYFRFRYDEDTNTFTEEYDSGTVVSLNAGSSSATETGNDIDATFYFTIDWDHPDVSTTDVNCTVIDTQSEIDTDWYEVDWRVETRLDYSVAPSVTSDDAGTVDRGDLDETFYIGGTLIYYESTDDNPASDQVDVWVSASEYGTSVGPWNDLTLTSGAFSVTCYADDALGQDTYTIKPVVESAGSAGTSLYYTTDLTDTYIADIIQVQITVVDDSRLDISTDAEIRVTLWLDYDNSYLGTGDSVTLDDVAMTWDDGNSWFDLSRSQASVGLWKYFVNSSSEATHGITGLDLNSKEVDVIWDQIVVVNYTIVTPSGDDRVDTGTTVTIDVELHYDYDDSDVVDGTVTVNGLGTAYQSLGKWRFTDSESTVMANIYNTVVCTGNAELITVEDNTVTQEVIWDHVRVVSYTFVSEDSRVSTDVTVTIDVELHYDYDESDVVDGTVTVNGLSTVYQSLGKWRFTDTESTVMANTYNTVVCTGNAEGITVENNTVTQEVIWDQIVVVSYTIVTPAGDNRVDTSVTVSIDVELHYNYDDSDVVDGTVTVNSLSTVYQSLGKWRFTDSEVTVMANTYNTVVCTGNAEGITVEDNTVTQQVIWDQIVVVSYTIMTPAGDNRVDTSVTVTIDVELHYDYDDSDVVDGTVTVNSLSTVYQSLGKWRFTDSEATVMANTYNDVVCTGNTEGITVEDNTVTQQVIWDEVIVVSYTVSGGDTRVNLDDNVLIDVTLDYNYDDSDVLDGTVTVNSESAVHQGLGVWRITVSKATVQLFTYDTVVCSGNGYGIAAVDQNSLSQAVIWDQIVVVSYTIVTPSDDSRVDINIEVTIDVELHYDYDDSDVADGTVTVNVLSAVYQSLGKWRFSDTEITVLMNTYNAVVCTGNAEGITVEDNTVTQNVIWDQIVVVSYTIVTPSEDSRVDTDVTVTIDVELHYDYDDSDLVDGTVTVNSLSTVYQSLGKWRFTDSEATVMVNTYNAVVCTGNAEGITVEDNTVTQEVIWDQIVVQTTIADDTRVNVGDNIEIRVTLWLAYDSTFLGAADTVTLDGTAMTWDGANSWFDLTVSQASVGLWSYFVNSSADSTYGITALDLNSQSVDVIWDRIVVQSTVVDDGRVDVSANAEIRVKLMLEYDSTFLGAADSVTLDGTAMTWDAGNSWFELTVSQATVGARTYFVNSSLDANYGIDLLDLSGNSVSVIWDRVQVQSYFVSDNRVNIGDSVDIDVTLLYDYDDSQVTDGSITVNGIATTHQGSGVWRFTNSEVAVVMNTYNLVVSTGNTHGLTVVDQNAQTLDVIWDRLVIVIGVDDASLLNNHQANFSLTVTYDYDDAVCTTYQIVIDRNSTWWHSFTDANVSLFVDIGSDISYFYNASLVSSESTYGITVFSTNTLQVTWSPTPNELPVNDSSPVLTNGDDTDYLYARYRCYVITTSVSDLDGYADISYVELSLYSEDQLTQYWTVRYTVGTDTFSVESGGLIVVVGALSNAVGVGNTLTITWHVKIGWDHADIVDSDIRQFVSDGTDTDSDFYETNWNVETRLDYSVAPSLSDDRGDANTGDLVATGSVTYYGSSLNPLSNETDIWVLHDLVGTWSGNLAAGSFSISGIGSSASVRLNTYTIKIVSEGSGSGGTELYFSTNPTDTFITDRIEIYEAGVVDSRINVNSDCEVWWRARYEYNGTEIQSALTLELNGSRTPVWDAGSLYWRWQETSISPASAGFDVASASESTYGLTAWSATTSVQQVIWDALVITLTDPVDQRIDVGANATGIFVSAVYAFDGAAFDGSFTLNNTNFQYAVPQVQGYTVLTASGDTHGITAIQSNDATYCIWDRILVVSVNADEIYHDPDDDVVISAELQYEYDSSPVLTGTFGIAGYPMTHVGSGVWEAQVTISTYQAIDFDDLTASDATLYGISEYNMDGNSATVYWDRLEFYSVSADDDRINVGASTEIQWSVRLENAGVSITTGVTAQMTGAIALTPSAGVYTATITESAVGSVTYSILTASLGEIGQFIQNASDATVIWDQVLLTSIVATPLSLDIRTATEIRVTLVYEFDSTDVTTGVVNLDDNGASVAMSYNSAGGYWSASVTKNTAGNYTYTVDSVTGNTHAISSLNTDGLSIEVEWVGVPGFVPDTMTLMIVGGGAGIAVLGAAIVASRRRRGGVAVAVGDIEPGDFGVVEPIEAVAPVEPEFIEPEAPVDLSKLTKKEVLDLLPDYIKETTSPKELKRLTKRVLIDIVELFRDVEG